MVRELASSPEDREIRWYNSTGPGANPDKRVTWAKKLSKEEAEKITVQSVLGGDDQWDPTTSNAQK